MSDGRALYLDLMKRSLMNLIYGDQEVIRLEPSGHPVRDAVVKVAAARGLWLVRPKAFDAEVRRAGRDWPLYGQTMLSEARLDNIQFCLESALRDKIPGDVIEAGVWRGGAAIFMRAILKAYSEENRTVWVSDSFEGLPEPDEKKYPHDTGDKHHTMSALAVTQEQVAANFARYGLLDEQVRFLKGWFKNTLPTAPIEKLAVMRLDGDMYESTMDALTALYPKLAPGGYVILDDYNHLAPCRQAVEDYRQQHGITEEIVSVDFSAVYWRRTLQRDPV